MNYGIMCPDENLWFNGWGNWWSKEPVYKYLTLRGVEEALRRVRLDADTEEAVIQRRQGEEK